MPVAAGENWTEDEDYSREEVIDAVMMHDRLDGTPKPGFEDFQWSKHEEPHQIRRRALIKAHPEVLKLVGPDVATAYWTLGFVSVQLFLSYTIKDLDWMYVIPVAATVGGLIAQSLTLAMHEISHNLAFRTQLPNLMLGIFANLPMGLPAFGTFRRYHLEHHKYQGEHGVDVDVPTETEAWLFRSRPMKVLWMFLQPAFYALRPLVVSPRSPGGIEIATVICQLTFDAAVYHFWGLKALLYLVLSTLLGMGLHVMAGHFVAEHAAMVRGQETYSYYGPLNIFAFNVGYHNEHHDLPGVPWTRLPQLRALAPEFYELPQHHSWAKVIYMWIAGSEQQDDASTFQRTTADVRTRARAGSRSPSSVSSEADDVGLEAELEHERKASASEFGPFSRVKRNTLSGDHLRRIEKMDRRRA